jgi:hypothetical protein
VAKECKSFGKKKATEAGVADDSRRDFGGEVAGNVEEAACCRGRDAKKTKTTGCVLVTIGGNKADGRRGGKRMIAV